MAAERQVRQGDRPLLDRTAVGEIAARAFAGANSPFDNPAVLAFDPGLAAVRRVPQGRRERPVTPQHQRTGNAPPARLVEDTGQAFLRLRFAGRLEPERRHKRDLGFWRDDGALAAHVPPFAGDSSGARERIDHLGGGRTAASFAARKRAFGEDEA